MSGAVEPQMQDVPGWVSGSMARGFQRPEKIDVLQLPRVLIGRIMGKAGATMKEIRECSGARIDARDQTEDPVQVLISGSTESVEVAKSMLLDAAEGAAVAIGGEEGSTVADTCRSTAEGDSNSQAAESSNNQVDPTATTAVSVDSAPMVEEHIELPRHATGKVIGTKGQQISEVRQRSGAQVDIDKSLSNCRVRLAGKRDQVCSLDAVHTVTIF